jgi:hypothetical protein
VGQELVQALAQEPAQEPEQQVPPPEQRLLVV